jgi:hypothetical protein
VIAGQGLSAATNVSFGSIAATDFYAESGGRLVAQSPPQSAGQVNVLVTTGDGTSKEDSKDRFTYIPPVPGAIHLKPTSGRTNGGATVAITGTGLTGATAVKFGAISATRFKVVSDSRIIAIAPPNSPGYQGVVVTTPGGTTKPALKFLYLPPVPFVTRISPNVGRTPGGTAVTITGKSLDYAIHIYFGQSLCTHFVVISDTNIRAIAPAGLAGVSNVVVTTTGGVSKSVRGDEFTYIPPLPVISSIVPNSGVSAGGTEVTILGSGFSDASSVLFGTIPALKVSVISDSQIVTVSPPEPAGNRYIFVITPGGKSKITTGAHYDVKAATPAQKAATPVH